MGPRAERRHGATKKDGGLGVTNSIRAKPRRMWSQEGSQCRDDSLGAQRGRYNLLVLVNCNTSVSENMVVYAEIFNRIDFVTYVQSELIFSVKHFERTPQLSVRGLLKFHDW